MNPDVRAHLRRTTFTKADYAVKERGKTVRLSSCNRRNGKEEWVVMDLRGSTTCPERVRIWQNIEKEVGEVGGTQSMPHSSKSPVAFRVHKGRNKARGHRITTGILNGGSGVAGKRGRPPSIKSHII